MTNSTPGLTSLVFIWFAMVLAMSAVFVLLWLPEELLKEPDQAAKQVWDELVLGQTWS